MNITLPPSSSHMEEFLRGEAVNNTNNVSSDSTLTLTLTLDRGWFSFGTADLVRFLHSPSCAFIAFACMGVSFLISLYNIRGHLMWYTQPHLQRCILRILLLVPCYALFSFLMILFIEERVWFDSMRDMWDAVVVYSFLGLMMEYCGGENACLSVIMNSPGSISHVMPLSCCLPPIPLNSRFLRLCKQLAIQFVVVKPMMAVSNLIGMVAGYEDAELYRQVRSVVYNTSYTLALYVLVLFYKATHAHPGLAKRNPICKFLSVKMVVFATYYQSLLFPLIPGLTSQQAELCNSFVLSCEMVFFSLLHLLAFGFREYKAKHTEAHSGDVELPEAEIEVRRKAEVYVNARNAFNLRDVLRDAYYNFSRKYRSHVQLADGAESDSDFGSLDQNEDYIGSLHRDLAVR